MIDTGHRKRKLCQVSGWPPEEVGIRLPCGRESPVPGGRGLLASASHKPHVPSCPTCDWKLCGGSSTSVSTSLRRVYTTADKSVCSMRVAEEGASFELEGRANRFLGTGLRKLCGPHLEGSCKHSLWTQSLEEVDHIPSRLARHLSFLQGTSINLTLGERGLCVQVA